MFYCPNCNNTYDIARTSSQVGGNINGVVAEAPDSSIVGTSSGGISHVVTTIATEVATAVTDAVTATLDQIDIHDPSSMVGGAANPTQLMTKILKDEPISQDDIKGLNIDHITKSIDYKKLKQEDKEKIYNKLQDVFPKEKKKIIETKPTESSDENLAFFVCSNCGYSIKIDDGTRIFTRTSTDISQSYTTGDYSDMLYSNILPKTRKYICPNKKCESHTNPAKRQAIFFRKNNSYEVVYICSACETSF
jgi:hypothetical protein